MSDAERPDELKQQSQALGETVDRHATRLALARREGNAIIRYTVMLGTLAILFVLPVVVGAYLGLWLDQQQPGYTTRWTVSLLVLGVALGAFNVYRFVKERW